MWWHTRRNQISSFVRNGTSAFKSAGGSQFSGLLAAEVCGISGSNAGYTMFRGSVKGTGYPLHSPISPSLSHQCVTVCHHISTGVKKNYFTGDRLQLKCDGWRRRTGGKVKGKLANAVGSQYPSHYLGTWCIQHYYRWCHTPLLPAVDWTEAHRPI